MTTIPHLHIHYRKWLLFVDYVYWAPNSLCGFIFPITEARLCVLVLSFVSRLYSEKVSFHQPY